MENNSKCALKIREAISICTILVILGTSIQLFKNKENNTELANQNNTEEKIEVAQSYERDAKVTTRSQEERTKKETKIAQATIKYKTIEEIEISKSMDLSKRCGISKEDFNKLMANLKVDTSGFFKRNSNTIYNLCEKYEVNEIFFCGLIAAESGWNIASSHRKANNYISMMSGGKLIRYSSEAEGLEAAAKLLSKKYLTPGGSCYSRKNFSRCTKKILPKFVNLGRACIRLYETSYKIIKKKLINNTKMSILFVKKVRS